MLWFEVQLSQPGGTARRVSCCGSTLYKLFERPLVPALDSLGSLPCRKDGTEGSVSPICCQDSWLDLHGEHSNSDDDGATRKRTKSLVHQSGIAGWTSSHMQAKGLVLDSGVFLYAGKIAKSRGQGGKLTGRPVSINS